MDARIEPERFLESTGETHLEDAIAPHLLQGLTEPQRRAVLHGNGPLLILAGPGSGKTRVMTHRIAHLIARGVPPWRSAALTFTNKAAEELRLRLGRLVPGADVWAGTFHRFCSKLLRRYSASVGLTESFTIYDRDDQRKVLKEAIADADVELFHHTPDQLAQAISRAKNRSVNPEESLLQDGSALASLAVRVLSHYQTRLLASNAVDFDDLLLHVAKLLTENPELRASLDDRFQHLLVDEYQDTNSLQYTIVRALSIDHPNLVVTGDPDQSIYGWRGADISNILDFERDYPQAVVVRLERNYRSTRRILEIADALIVHNQRRRHKALFTENAEGIPVRLCHYPDHRDEADRIAEMIAQRIADGERRPADFAIFYRINSLSRSFEMALRRRGVPYQVVQGLEFFQRKEVKDVLAYLTLLVNPRDEVAFGRIVNVPTRGIGRTSLERLRTYATQRRVSSLEAARQAASIPGLNARAAKALERFAEMMDRLALRASGSVEELMGLVLDESGLRKSLEESEADSDRERLANVDELLTAARDYDSSMGDQANLEGFLEQSVLVADTDAWEPDHDKVTLMTLHAAKGLEFPCVFIVALEHDLLPHSRSKEDPDSLEEERRLLFVGITRAEEELQLSLAHYRAQRGSVFPTSPSCFLMELPRDRMEVHDYGVDDLFRLDHHGERAWRPHGDLRSQRQSTDFDPFDFEPVTDAFDGIDLPVQSEASETSERAAPRGADAEEGLQFHPDPELFLDSSSADEFVGERESTGERSPISRRASMAKPKFITASEMLSEAVPTKKVDPEHFRYGQMVRHPEYGPGKIVALSGTGSKRTAEVDFFGHGRKRFRLAFSPLVPLGD